MVTALVLLSVVLITHYFPKVPFLKDFIKDKGYIWVKIYLEFMLNLFKRASLLRGEGAAILTILPVIIITYLINNLFILLLKEWGHMIFMMVTLYYCLNCDIEDEHESILILAHERIFGVLFWFAIFGATGAMLYWILTVSKAMSDRISIPITNFQRGLNIMHGLAAWLPARVTGLIYALVGDFVGGFNCWHSYMRAATVPSSKVLLDCGQASLDSLSSREEEELVERALVAWVIVGMLIALIIAEVKL